MADDEIDLNAEIAVELTPYGSLDLDQEWVAYLSESAEVPSTVEGVDPSITYDDDGTAYA
jgi:beta-xylosidase